MSVQTSTPLAPENPENRNNRREFRGTSLAVGSVVNPLTRLVALSLLVTTCACSYQLVSPPARLVSIESARPVGRNETMVGARTGAYTQVFDQFDRGWPTASK
jgi:hypothetical protein